VRVKQSSSRNIGFGETDLSFKHYTSSPFQIKATDQRSGAIAPHMQPIFKNTLRITRSHSFFLKRLPQPKLFDDS
jgi:hypothetical protein